MAERFFVEEPITADRAILTGAEVHHLAHVLRARRGDFVTLFDGSGAEWRARVDSIERAKVELTLVEQFLIDRELPFELTMAVSLPRGDRQKWLAEKLTELGVTRLVPLLAQRTVVEPGTGARDRLRRAVIEAAKQCGRNRLMEIGAPRAIAEYLATPYDSSIRFMAHPGLERAHSASMLGASSVQVAVGPEGGFTDEEFELGRANGWLGLDLGPRILRIETAAVALAALLSQNCG